LVKAISIRFSRAGLTECVRDKKANMSEQYKSVLRIRKHHTPAERTEACAEDGQNLLQKQSIRDASIAAVIVVILFSILWAMLSTLTDRIFPWMTLVLGILIGVAVRIAGQGVDWRFPAIAAISATLGAVISNIVVAAAFTADVLETSTLAVLRAVTSMTWPVFFDEAVSSADIAYGLFAAAIAAFYANRRLSRMEFLALRKWQHKQGSDRHQ
jgi:hypothetical protein